jgi:hypothetical protein
MPKDGPLHAARGGHDAPSQLDGLTFALVARDLAIGHTVADIPLFWFIAEMTVDAFGTSTGGRRRAGRRGR